MTPSMTPIAVEPGTVLSYVQMCELEGVNLQQGMNYRQGGGLSVILMSLRRGAPYADRVEEVGRVLVYEGHDVPRSRGGPDPKVLDQQLATPTGSETQNGLFFHAAKRYQRGEAPPERVRVYEKIRSGIWVFNGIFELVDAWQEQSGARMVYKFRLRITDDSARLVVREREVEQSRVIPSSVKIQVWKRDGGKCVICGATDNLHFDHVIPYSLGGSSLVPQNVQLLCARHNLEKWNRLG